MVQERPCLILNLEETDTRMCLHVWYALEKGSRIIQVRTVDTDVVVILIGVCGELLTMFPTAQIWVSFGMGDNFQQIHINTVCLNLGDFKAHALPGFHAILDVIPHPSSMAKQRN